MDLPIYVILCYAYLLTISCYSLSIYSLIGVKTNLDFKSFFEHNLYCAFILAFFLSLVQIYQSIDLFFGKFSKYWWIPMFCKHFSLLVYIALGFYILELTEKGKKE